MIPAEEKPLVGQRSNLHPSGELRYDVEVIDQAEGEVRVRYLTGSTPAWWITEQAWREWRKLVPR